MNRYPSMDQPRGYKRSGGKKKKINDEHMLYSIRSVRKAAQLYNRRNLSTFTKLDYIETVPKRNRIELTLRGVHVFFTTLYRNTQTGVEKKKKKNAREISRNLPTKCTRDRFF